jgi:Metal binding domain of Ada
MLLARRCTAAWLICSASWVVYARAADTLPAHSFAARHCLDVLPDGLSQFFRDRSGDFEKHVLAPGDEWTRDRKFKRRKRWHQVQTDVATEVQSLQSRMAAFDAFPRDKRSAQRLYRRNSGRDGGILPWAIADLYDRLVDAFRSESAATIVERAGHLAHFVVDASDPFRATANSEGRATANPVFGEARGVHSASAHATVSQRFNHGLLLRNRGVYSQSVQLEQSDYEPVIDPLDSAFALLELSLAVVDHVAAADRDCLVEAEITDRQSFEKNVAAYYDSFDESCGEICVSQLSTAAVWSAGFIGGAWEAAGKPSVESILSRSDSGSDPDSPKSRSVSTSTSTSTRASFIGSKNSNVYHKPSCRFAKQISDDNLVTFPSSAEAKSQRRRPCRSCKPD